MQRHEAIVIGGGPAGMAAALSLAGEGVATALIAPPPPPDTRTTALLAGSMAFLDRLGTGERVRAAGAPLVTMRLVDATGRLFRAPTVTFHSSEIGLPAFGWNVPNDDLNRVLDAAIDAAPTIARVRAKAEAIVIDEMEVRVETAEGEHAAPLAIAADGRESATRAAAGIGVRRWSYEQAALVTNLRHELPHEGTSTEFHTPSGPFTLVPLPGERSSLVCVERPSIVRRLAGLCDADLAREVERRAASILGRMEVDGPRHIWPLGGLVAMRPANHRVILVGEAAHGFPPIGAQGLNLSLRDAAEVGPFVARALREGRDAGAPDVLAGYVRRRRFDVMTRAAAVDLLNRSLLTGLLPVQAARGAALGLIEAVGPLRRLLMREGVTPSFSMLGTAGSRP